MIVKSLPFAYTTLSACIAALLYAPTTQAQTEPEATEEIERIMVTTQRRTQAIQDVPATISAYSGELLEELGIVELDVLSDITPGLVIQEQSPNNPGFVIRGITSDSGSAQAAPRVSIFYNGVDISRSRGSYFELFDIERVEVVRGPQSTLFGTAAAVGALAVSTNKPQQEFAASLRASTGNYNARSTEGFVTGGNSRLQGRLALSYRERDGYINNIAGSEASQNPNGIRQDDMNGIQRLGVRPSLRWLPTDDVTVDLVYTYERNEDTGTSFKNGLFAPTGGDTSPYSFVEMSGSPLSAEVLGREKLGLDRTLDDLNLTVNWELNDSLTFTSISGLRSFDSLEVFDADGTQAWFLEFAEDAEGDQFSQEFRFTQMGDRSTMLFGVNYFSEDGSQRVPFSTEESIFLNCMGMLGSGLPCVNEDGSVNLLTPLLTGGAAEVLPYQAEYTNFGDNSSYSAFFDIAYDVSETLELTAGLRYVDESKESGYSSALPASVLAGIPLLPIASTDGERFTASASYNDWLPRFNALYRINPQMNLYATIGKGRRAEVLSVSSAQSEQGTVVPDVTEVAAEIIWNYEAGVKGFLFDRAMNYTASVFYQDYSDFQVTLQDDAGNFYTDNAGAARNVGFEADLRYRLSDHTQVFSNMAYIDARIDRNSSNGDLAGNRFRMQPEWTFSSGLFHQRPLTSTLNLTSSLVYSFRSDIYFDPDNEPVMGLDIAEGAVQLTNLRIGIEHPEQRWSVKLYANNLFDKSYLVDAGNTGGSFGNPTFIAGSPRMIGIEFHKQFGF
ncbi:TonB-dependent receptor [Aliidiomarina soli]|uniref:TonB-dependent receptor n=1 Tax=Aliidiomarina soli TaxID=1928574 RepID=A0A432WC14_9GAMM|nr:TonB-dependent receptor [Aliidiomarina soli]RUO29586.1 TonB-dependent receptor [Aliidiomarina soli]